MESEDLSFLSLDPWKGVGGGSQMASGDAFNVVVVGGGAAGCVVAARLAESRSRSVLLLEAGPDRRADLPDEMRDGWGITREDFDWGYLAEPTAHADARHLWRKKLLGGTSWLTRFTPRGGAADYDAWSASGISGWTFKEVLPYFTRLEADADFGDQPWHGQTGPIPSLRHLDREYTEITTATLEALEALGFPWVDDHNHPDAVGVGRMPMNTPEGRRVTTVDAYLPLGSTPPNLTIRPNAQVSHVLFDGERACGVQLVDATVIEADWTVLCAGTYGTPPLLLRSGIGPAAHLSSVGVPVLVDLPGVGANLADHPALDLDCGYRGPAGSGPVLHAIATFHSSERPIEQSPDLMLWLSDPEGEPAGVGIGVVLLKPESRGAVRLRSAHPAEAPSIELPNLSSTSDLQRLAEGYRLALEVANSPQVRRGCADAVPGPRDDRKLRDTIRTEAFSVPHVVGTCAIGPRPDDGAVVDASGHVHGTERLSVVDASIIPEAPSGFTHIPTIMVAERLSEQIASLV